MGVDQIQVDVHATSHDELVAIHDPDLDRTTNGTGPVAVVSPDVRGRIRLNGTQDETLSLLDGLIKIIGPSKSLLRLELKHSACGQPTNSISILLINLLRRTQMLERTIACRFDFEDVMSLMQIPALHHVWMLSTAYLAEHTPAQALSIATSRGIPGLGLRWNALTTGFAEEMRSAGLKLGVFGCNEEKLIRVALVAMPDGLSTDRPDLALRARAGG